MPRRGRHAEIAAHPVNDILAHHGMQGLWESMRATGVANRIYATRDVVLRIATEHSDAVADARSVCQGATGILLVRIGQRFSRLGVPHPAHTFLTSRTRLRARLTVPP